jgi:hypothetical protein
MLNPLYDTSVLNFASILSTENNTAITISNIPDGTVQWWSHFNNVK